MTGSTANGNYLHLDGLRSLVGEGTMRAAAEQDAYERDMEERSMSPLPSTSLASGEISGHDEDGDQRMRSPSVGLDYGSSGESIEIRGGRSRRDTIKQSTFKREQA